MGRKRPWWKRVVEWFTSDEPKSKGKSESPPPPPPPPPSRTTFSSPEPPEDFPRPAQDLPPGWKFEGLYYGDRNPSDRRVINKDPSDWDIANADDVIVSYTDALGVVYRTVHGANSRAGVGKVVARTTQVVSPPR